MGAAVGAGVGAADGAADGDRTARQAGPAFVPPLCFERVLFMCSEQLVSTIHECGACLQTNFDELVASDCPIQDDTLEEVERLPLLPLRALRGASLRQRPHAQLRPSPPPPSPPPSAGAASPPPSPPPPPRSAGGYLNKTVT